MSHGSFWCFFLPSSSPSLPPAFPSLKLRYSPFLFKSISGFFQVQYPLIGLPRWHSRKWIHPKMQETKRCGFNLWVRNICWIRKWKPILLFLPGEFHGQRSLMGYSPWGCKEADITEHTHTHTHTHKHWLPVLIHLKLFTTRKMKLSVVPSYHPSPWLCPGLTTLVLWVKKAFRRFISNKYKWENGTIFTISRDIIVWKFHQSWSRCLKTWVWVQVLILRDCRS